MKEKEPQDRWPRNRQRERVLLMVREHEGPVAAVDLAERTGLHVTTVRFHLDGLCDEGVIARTRIQRSGVGRPRTGYVAVQGRMDYPSLAEVLAMELGDTLAERQERCENAGQRLGDRIVAATDTPASAEVTDNLLEHRTAAAAAVFDRMGFKPELTSVTGPADHRERSILLHACPIREFAHLHQEVSCGVHLGLLRSLLTDSTDDAEPRPKLTADLQPLVGPNLCIARVTADEQPPAAGAASNAS